MYEALILIELPLLQTNEIHGMHTVCIQVLNTDDKVDDAYCLVDKHVY